MARSEEGEQVRRIPRERSDTALSNRTFCDEENLLLSALSDVMPTSYMSLRNTLDVAGACE